MNDYITHHGDWRRACEIAKKHAEPSGVDHDDSSYWQHQIDTLDRLSADPPPSVEVERMADHFTKYHLHGPWPFHPVIHHISAPDHGDPHDHPWPFRSVILHGWYLEEIFRTDESMRRRSGINPRSFMVERPQGESFSVAANHIHRITEVSEGGCWTLIIPGEWERTPGFYQFREDGTYRRDWNGEWEKQG